jgi:DNA-binding response OmpR family regulator
MLVLVVEDEALIAEDVAALLKEAGHQVSGPATTAEEAVRMTEAGGADLALVDINLCGREDGPGLARALWERFGVPCLFVTAQPAQAREHRDAAVGVLSKPYAAQDLVESVPMARAAALGEKVRSWQPRNLELFGSDPVRSPGS